MLKRLLPLLSTKEVIITLLLSLLAGYLLYSFATPPILASRYNQSDEHKAVEKSLASLDAFGSRLSDIDNAPKSLEELEAKAEIIVELAGTKSFLPIVHHRTWTHKNKSFILLITYLLPIIGTCIVTALFVWFFTRKQTQKYPISHFLIISGITSLILFFVISRNTQTAKPDTTEIGYAIDWGGPETMEAYFELGMDPNEIVGGTLTSFQHALRQDTLESILPLFLEKGADYNTEKSVQLAIEHGRELVLQKAIERGYKLNEEELISAGKSADGAAMKFLIEEWEKSNPPVSDKLLYQILFEAAFQNNNKATEYLLEAGANPFARNIPTKRRVGLSVFEYVVRTGFEPMYFSILKKYPKLPDTELNYDMAWKALRHPNILSSLCEQGLVLEPTDKSQSGLVHTVAKGQEDRLLESLEILIKNGVDLDRENRDEQTALFEAASSRSYQVLERLIQEGVPVNHRDEYSRTALFEAIKASSTKSVNLLLDNGAEVNIQGGYDRDTPLHIAAEQDSISILESLIAHGAAIDKMNRKPETPLYISLDKRKEEVANTLINKGANIHKKSGYSAKTPLHIASRKNLPNAVKLLVDKGAKVNEPDKEGTPPLYDAVVGGNAEIVKLLIQQGADASINKKSNNHWKNAPIHAAIGRKGTEILDLLIANGANINIKNNQLETPLHIAADRQDIEAVKLLLAKGAKVNTKDRYGTTPLLESLGYKANPELIKLLLDNGANTNAYYGIRRKTALQLGKEHSDS